MYLLLALENTPGFVTVLTIFPPDTKVALMHEQINFTLICMIVIKGYQFCVHKEGSLLIFFMPVGLNPKTEVAH